MVAALVVLFVLATVPGETPVRGALEESLLEALLQMRSEAGLAPLREEPRLRAAADRRAAEVAATGAVEVDAAMIPRLSRELFRAGYRAHRWAEVTVLGPGDAERIASLWADDGDRLRTTVLGDFEDVAIGVAGRDGEVAVTLLLALPKLTALRRAAAPFADLEAVRGGVLAAANRERERAGRTPLATDPRLAAAAQRHAEDMLGRSYFDHRSPDGGTIEDRVAAAGYPPARMLGENLAKGLFTPEEVVERWMKSSGHRRNLLRAEYAETGIGVALAEEGDDLTVVWVQVFADPL